MVFGTIVLVTADRQIKSSHHIVLGLFALLQHKCAIVVSMSMVWNLWIAFKNDVGTVTRQQQQPETSQTVCCLIERNTWNDTCFVTAMPNIFVSNRNQTWCFVLVVVIILLPNRWWMCLARSFRATSDNVCTFIECYWTAVWYKISTCLTKNTQFIIGMLFSSPRWNWLQRI